jgi:hypothetical protein
MMVVGAGRHYFFSPRPWSAASWQALRATPRSSIHTSP